MPTGVYNHLSHPGCIKKGHPAYKYWLGRKRPKMSGKNHPMWKGGKIKSSEGRYLIFKPEHPFCDKQRYIRQSRLVMEKKIGRLLKPEEIVHHINGDKSDDRPKNLWLFKNTETHTNYERNLQLTYKKWGISLSK